MTSKEEIKKFIDGPAVYQQAPKVQYNGGPSTYNGPQYVQPNQPPAYHQLYNTNPGQPQNSHPTPYGPSHAAQTMIDEGRRKDAEYEYMYGDYYEKKAMKKAMKMFGPPPQEYVHARTEELIEEGKAKDRKYGFVFGNYKEKRARRKASLLHGW